MKGGPSANGYSTEKNFAGKKITLMGLGLLGRGLGDAKFLAAAGAHLVITDLKSEAELVPSLRELGEFPNIIYHLGGHKFEDFEDRDMIVRAPNAPLDSPFLARARSHGIPVEMDASLFAKLVAQFFPRTKIVGVTGTRGKSTVTHLIYEMARAAFNGSSRDTDGVAGKHAVYLGGNERDTATLPLIGEINDGDLVILELDSWQLQGFEESNISPNISVWTNFMPDHMNYYHGDMDRYFEDKAAIARFQKAGDSFVTMPEIKEKIESRFGALQAACITDAALPTDWEITLPGEHNRANAAMALAAARCLGIPDGIVKKVLTDFKGLPNRLEFMGENNDISFYNDGNSTTPEATIAALKTLAAKNKPIVLIAGGSDKELDFMALAGEMAKSTAIADGAATIKKAILFQGKATEKLKALLPKDFPVAMAADMDEAFIAALAAAAPGDIVLLSPAATSFGIFKNEYDRSDQFRTAFLKIAERK